MAPGWEYTRGFRRGYEEGYRRAFAAAAGHRGYYDDDRYGYTGRGPRPHDQYETPASDTTFPRAGILIRDETHGGRWALARARPARIAR